MPHICQFSIALTICLSLTACGGSSDKPSAPVTPKNSAPTVTVENVTVNENTSVTITSSANDADGDVLTYSWSQTSGETISFTDNGTSITFDTPEIDSDTALSFDVSVSDGLLTSNATSTVSVINTPEPTITMSDVLVTESNDIQQTTVLLTLSNAYSKDINFNYLTVDDTAKQDQDYQAINGSGTIAVGEIQYSFDINIIGDTKFAHDDEDEVFRLTIEDVEFALIDKNYSEITIKNDHKP